ncbi:MAG TPA: TetR/AcrR family transcriptional regulator [Nevskiaceae bacterium]|nr:TetR/AcrR family transcriptional regulator [Nevskiaceae bacterium]
MGRPAKAKPSPDRQSAKLARIMSVTQQLLGEVGVENITMRDLAHKSRVAAATLYNRFGTKDRLVTAAVIDHYELAIANVVARRATSQQPLDQVVENIRVIARDCQRRPGFAQALMVAYFKVGNDREMPTRLYAALLHSLLPPIQQMQADGQLQPWVSAQEVAEELCDRMFASVMKWSQGLVPKPLLLDHALRSLLLSLAGASTRAQADAIGALLARKRKKS